MPNPNKFVDGILKIAEDLETIRASERAAIRQDLNHLTDQLTPLLGQIIPPGTGFAFMTFKLGEENAWLSFSSNSDPASMVKVLRTMANHIERGGYQTRRA